SLSQFDAIIGIDVLDRMEAMIDIRNRTVILPGGTKLPSYDSLIKGDQALSYASRASDDQEHYFTSDDESSMGTVMAHDPSYVKEDNLATWALLSMNDNPNDVMELSEIPHSPVEFVARPLPTSLRGGTLNDFKNFSWEAEYPNTLVEEPPNILPPFRAGLNHRILIDDINYIPTNTKPYSVPDRYQEQLQKRLEQGLKDGIFYRTVSNKASPMFCTPKKDPTQARFVIDLRKRNSVTQHLPVDPGDQDHILHTLARARYRSAIDLKDGYPQVRIHPDD